MSKLWVKCDTPTCDYKKDVKSIFEMKKYVNQECPKCKANLMTERDFKVFRIGYFIITPISLPFEAIGWVLNKVFKVKLGKVHTQVIDGQFVTKEAPSEDKK